MNYNKMILIGHLVQNPEVKQFPSGDQYVVFSIGYNQSKKMPDGNWRTDSYFFDVEYTGKLTDVVSQNKKGDGVLVEGTILYREYMADDGSKKRFYTLKADKVVVLSRKEHDLTQPPQTTQPGNQQQTAPKPATAPQYPPQQYPPQQYQQQYHNQYQQPTFQQQNLTNSGQFNGQNYDQARPAFSNQSTGVPF